MLDRRNQRQDVVLQPRHLEVVRESHEVGKVLHGVVLVYDFQTSAFVVKLLSRENFKFLDGAHGHGQRLGTGRPAVLVELVGDEAEGEEVVVRE